MGKHVFCYNLRKNHPIDLKLARAIKHKTLILQAIVLTRLIIMCILLS